VELCAKREHEQRAHLAVRVRLTSAGAFCGALTPTAPPPALLAPLQHFFNYIQQYDRNGIVANSGQLWRWTPIVTAGGGGFPDRGGASGPSSIDPIVMGHTAGIVLGLLLGGANLFYLYRLAQNARVDVCGCGARGPKGERRACAITHASPLRRAHQLPPALAQAQMAITPRQLTLAALAPRTRRPRFEESAAIAQDVQAACARATRIATHERRSLRLATPRSNCGATLGSVHCDSSPRFLSPFCPLSFPPRPGADQS
jgi:hypothetical protein